jgi:hypothetical protein
MTCAIAVQTVTREGLPVLFQVDYSALRAGVRGRAREEFLGRRHHEANLAMRYLPGSHVATPAVAASPEQPPTLDEGAEHTHAWQYLKPAAMLDYLRVHGEQPFDDALELQRAVVAVVLGRGEAPPSWAA